MLRLFLFIALLLPLTANAQVGGAAGGSKGRANKYIPDPPPGGDFNYSVANHQAIRALTGTSPGETLETTDARYIGSWDAVGADPCSNGDDSTWVVQDASGTWWRRDFAHTEGDPINMRWYEKLANNFNITHWLTTMSNCFGSTLHIKVGKVSGVDTLKHNFINWTTEGISTFTFLEDDGIINLVYTGVGDTYRAWRWTSFSSIKIGGPNEYIRFLGNHPGIAYMNNSQGDAAENAGHIQATGPSGASFFEFEGHVYNAQGRGIYVSGSGGPTCSGSCVSTVNISGLVQNGGIHTSDIVTLTFDVTVSDPWDVGGAWDGFNNGSNIGCMADASGNSKEQRSRSINMIRNKNVRGYIERLYGQAAPFFSLVENIGVSINDPLVIETSNFGRSGPNSITGKTSGVWVHKGPNNMGWGKGDDMPTYGHTQADFRFLKLTTGTNNYGWGAYAGNITDCGGSGNEGINNNTSQSHAFWAEASGNAPGYKTAYFHVTLDASLKALSDIQSHDDNWIDLHTVGYAVSGDESWGHVLVVPDTLRDHDINIGHEVTVDGQGTGQVVDIVFREASPDPIADNTVRDITITGQIKWGSGTYGAGNTWEGVTFNGGGTVATVPSGATVSVPAGVGNGLTGPSGATITGAGTLNCNGSPETLPYTFVTGTGNCEY